MEHSSRHLNTNVVGATKMTNNSQVVSDTLASITAKASPPVGVSLATVAGIHIHDLVLWATLVYTVLMIGHKIWRIYKDVTKKERPYGYED